MRYTESILALSLLLCGTSAAILRASQPVQSFLQTSSLETSSDDDYFDPDNSNVYWSTDNSTNITRIYVTENGETVSTTTNYGSYKDSNATVTPKDDDSETIEELVNEYHENGGDSDSDSDVTIEGVNECEDCTDIVVPAGEYREYTEEITTEYDEYYLVRVPVTRYDVYDIIEVPQTTHYVYYKTGNSEVVDEVTECNDCDEDEGTSGTTSSGSSGTSGGTKNVEETEPTETSSDDNYSSVDSSGRQSSSSNVGSGSSGSSGSGSGGYNNGEEEYCDVSDEVETVEVQEVDEYVVDDVEGGCDHCDLFLQESYPQLYGDPYDNDQTDSVSLTLVSPSDGTQRTTWYEIDDEDQKDYEKDVRDSDNPVVPYTTLVQYDDPLDRDESDLPDSLDDDKNEALKGDLRWVLIGAFENNEQGEGKIYVIPEDDPEEASVLISGLDKPAGICFDKNYNFLYVVDPTFEDQGFIYQFLIDWNDDGHFNLKSTEYTIVYQGANPYSCWVDAYSNLYFVDATENAISIISYLDLWTGFTNDYYTMYGDNSSINTPVGINVYKSEEIFFVNNVVNTESGALNRASTEDAADSAIKEVVINDVGAWALAVSKNYIHFITTDNALWSVDVDDYTDSVIRVKNLFNDARGVCYGDDHIYVTDFAAGKVYKFEDSNDEEYKLNDWTGIQNPYSIYCVNS